MKLLLLFAALFGCTLATLNHPFQYTYQYEGHIFMGLPEINSQVSAASMKAQLIVQAIDANTLLCKLNNLEVAEELTEISCTGHERFPKLQTRPVQGVAQKLEDVFEVHVQNNEGNVMIVTKSEEEWVTDVRKSIANSLNLRQMINIGQPRHAMELYAREQTFFGKCGTSYSVVPNVRPYGDQQNFTEVVRSIDFDQCENSVLLTRAGVGNLTKAGQGQFSSVQSRTSIGTYYLENFSGSTYDIKQIVVQGNVIQNPFGYTTEKLVSTTNQTFALLRKESISKRLELPGSIRNVRSWQMEVASPYKPSSSPEPWMNYYNDQSFDQKYLPILTESVATGIKLDEDLQKQFDGEVRELLTQSAKELAKMPQMPPSHAKDPNPWKYSVGKVSYNMDVCVRLVRAIPVNMLDQMFQDFFAAREKSESERIRFILFVDVLGASGSSTSIKVVLDKIADKKISNERAASLFMTLTNNLVSTTVLGDLMTFAKQQNLKQNPYLTSTVWINFASTLNRVCFNPKSWKYAVPHQVYGDKACHTQALLDEILPFFRQQLQQATHTWERTVIVQALTNLGVPQSLHVLTTVINGDYDSSVRLRSMAVYGLVHSKMTENSREQVFQILIPIIQDRLQPSGLRQVAIFVALTWHPNTAFWKRLESISWSETGRDIPAFIYYLTESYSKSTDPALARQAHIAKFILPTVKPFVPALRYSYENFWSRDLPKEQMDTEANMFMLNTEREMIPRNLYFFLFNNFGGLKTPIFEMTFDSEHRLQPIIELFNQMRSISREQREQMVRDKYHRQAQDLLSAIKDQLNPETDSQIDLSVYLAIFDKVQVYFPINQEVITKVMGPGGSRTIAKLIQGQRFSFTKFWDPVQMEALIPTEIGLPLLSRVSNPTVFIGDSRLQLAVEGQSEPTIRDLLTSKQVTLKIDANFKFVTKTISTLRALLPWSDRLITTGIDNLKNINLPAHYNLTYAHPIAEVRNLTLAVVPQVKEEEFPVSHMHNIPFVAIKRMWPGGRSEEIVFEAVQAIADKPLIQENHYLNEKYFGLNGRLQWVGDVVYPFTRGYFLDYVMQPQKMMTLLTSPTSKMWAATMSLDFSKSHTKAFYPSIGFVQPLSAPDMAFSPSENRQVGNMKVSQMYNIVPRILLNGTQTRFFESIVSWKQEEQQSNQKNQYTLGYAVQRSALPGYDSQSAGYCFDMTSYTPAITNYQQLMTLLSGRSIEMTTSGKITGGVRCEEKNIADFSGKMTLSEQRQQIIYKEMKNKCNADRIDPLMRVDVDAVYDTAFLDVNFDQHAPANFLNFTYQAYDVLRGAAAPHVYFNYMNIRNPQGKIHVRGQKRAMEYRWQLNTTMPTETMYLERFWVPKALNELIPIGGFQNQNRERQSFDELVVSKSDVCKVELKQGKLITFDGVSIPYEIQPCYTVLSMDKRDDVIVKLRTPLEKEEGRYQSEVMVVSPRDSMFIHMRYNSIQVNGKNLQPSSFPIPVHTSSGKFFAKVNFLPGQYTELVIPGNMTVRFTQEQDQVLITPAQHLRERLTGLCGNFNGDQSDDLKTPSGQKVEQKEQLPLAWTIKEGKQCDAQKLQQEKESLQQALERSFQTTEQKRSQRLDEKSECQVFVHPVKEISEQGKQFLCVTEEAVPRCHPRCTQQNEKKQEEQYLCFQKSRAPQEVSRSVNRGYTKAQVNQEPQFRRNFQTKHVNTCRRA